MSKQQQQQQIGTKPSQCSFSHKYQYKCSLQQSKQILQNQLRLIKEENDNLKRIQQTLKLALKQNKNKITKVEVENSQNQEQADCISFNKKSQSNIINCLFQRTQVFQAQQSLMSYQELYQKQLRKTSDLDMEIDRLQQKKKSEWQTKQKLKQNNQKMRTQKKYKHTDNQELCSQFNAFEPIILSSYHNHNKTNIIQGKSKTSRSQSCQKMDKFMKTLLQKQIQNSNHNRQRTCSTSIKPQTTTPNHYNLLNLKATQKQKTNKKLSILVDKSKNTQSFINIKINQNYFAKQKQPLNKDTKEQNQNNIKNQRNQREIVLKIINDDLIKLRI